MHGTFRVVQPFGATGSSLPAASAATAACTAAAHAAAREPAPQYISSCSQGRSRAAVPVSPAQPYPRRPASAGPCCGGSSSRNGLCCAGDPAAASTGAPVWNAKGAGSVLGRRSSSSTCCIASQWLSGGTDDLALLQQWQQQHHRQRPRSASAVRPQRPVSAQSAGQYSGGTAVGNAVFSSAIPVDSAGVGHAAAVAAVAVTSYARTSAGQSSVLEAAPAVRPLSCPPGATACSVGLAERRRLVESMLQDLTDVRLLH